jgi:hypothetical protein
MLIDTLEGDMFMADPIELDLSEELSQYDSLYLGFVGDGTPFVDRDGNVHHLLFGCDGEHVAPVHIWHLFYDPGADTLHWTLVDSVPDRYFYSVGINSLCACRGQIGQNRENGNLYAIWEEFIQEPGLFVTNTTGDTFAPVRIKMARSKDNGLSWEVYTILEPSGQFENHWLRFPLISPEVISYVEGDSLYDRVVWGFYDDFDPGWYWQGEGSDTTVILWVGIKDFYDTTSVREEEIDGEFRLTYRIQGNSVFFYVFSDVEAQFTLKIYDVSGRLIKVLHRDRLSPGLTTIRWDMRDKRGVRVPTGVYLFDGQLGSESFSGKIVVP